MEEVIYKIKTYASKFSLWLTELEPSKKAYFFAFLLFIILKIIF